MKKTAYTVMVLCLIGMSMHSCKKSSTTVSSNSTLLTNGTWTFQKNEYLQSGTWVADPFPQFENKYTVLFNPNGTFAQYDPAISYTANGTWTLSSDGTQLTITNGQDGFLGIYTFVQLTQSTFEATNPSNTSSNYTGVRLTLTR